MHSVSSAARLCGVSPSTLRAWERRYGVVEPIRTEGGYRVYDDAALRRLTRMSSLIASGWPPRHAAAYVINEDGEGDGALPLAVLAEEEPPDPVPPTMKEEREEIGVILAAAQALDAPRVSDELDFVFSIHAFDDLVDRWLTPMLEAAQEARESDRLSEAGEHFLIAGIQRRLAACFDEAGRSGSAPGPSVVLGACGSARNPILPLALATCLRRRGCAVTYLGVDPSLEDWTEAVDGQHADCVTVSIPAAADRRAGGKTVTALAKARPGVPVYYYDADESAAELATATRLTGRMTVCVERIVKEHEKALATAS